MNSPGKEPTPLRDAVAMLDEAASVCAAACAAVGLEEPAAAELAQEQEEDRSPENLTMPDFVQIWPLPADESANPMPAKASELLNYT